MDMATGYVVFHDGDGIGAISQSGFCTCTSEFHPGDSQPLDKENTRNKYKLLVLVIFITKLQVPA